MKRGVEMGREGSTALIGIGARVLGAMLASCAKHSMVRRGKPPKHIHLLRLLLEENWVLVKGE